MEPGVTVELQADYGIGPDISPGHNAATDAFYADLVAVFQVGGRSAGALDSRGLPPRTPHSTTPGQALAIVVNNGPASIGGGGDPLGPLAPPICGAVCGAAHAT